MKKLLTAAAIAATLGAALPAAAQTWNGGGFRSERDVGFRSDRNIEFRIERGVRNGSLTPSEARTLTRQLQDVRRLEWSYGRNGVSASEARELDRRYARLESRLRSESRDRDDRYGGGYGRYGDGYGRGGFGYR